MPTYFFIVSTSPYLLISDLGIDLRVGNGGMSHHLSDALNWHSCFQCQRTEAMPCKVPSLRRANTTSQAHSFEVREVCEKHFSSAHTIQDYRNKGIIPYTQIAGKILYRLSDINQPFQENFINRSLYR